MTKKEALAQARKIRDEKLFRDLYEKNKFAINEKSYVGFDAWKARVKKAWDTNQRYENVKTLTGAGKRMLRTKEYIDRDKIGEFYIRESLSKTKTGRKIKWGQQLIWEKDGKGPRYIDRYRDETMFDVLRAKVGIGKKIEFEYDYDTRSYHVIDEYGNQIYEVVMDKYERVLEIV